MVVTIAAFMEVLDTTIVNVALPHIAGSLAVSSDNATWSLTTYLVTNGIVFTISGSLSCQIRAEKIFSAFRSRGLRPRLSPVGYPQTFQEFCCSGRCRGFSAAGFSQPSRISF